MYELIMKVPEHDVTGFLLGGLGILCGTTVVLTAIIARCWGRYNQRHLASPLIQEMLDRGMNSDEIETIFATAFTGRRRGLGRWFQQVVRSLPRRERATA
ncbi:MAG: hypothetical protein M3552_12335 [Planctomycetota bacterium]|nr:hypothetical protein [Planctomycetota bacterium]